MVKEIVRSEVDVTGGTTKNLCRLSGTELSPKKVEKKTDLMKEVQKRTEYKEF